MTPMSRELLGYVYQHHNGAGVPEAMGIARQWLEEILQEPWWPGDSVRYLVHLGDGKTCDAIKATYRVSDAAGKFTIAIIQTLFFIVVTVRNAPGGKLEAADLARRLFNSAGRLQLTGSARDTSGATGRQLSRGVPYTGYDWLDTMQWWSGEDLVGFEMLKRTGPDRGTIVRPELEANLVWFARLQ